VSGGSEGEQTQSPHREPAAPYSVHVDRSDSHGWRARRILVLDRCAQTGGGMKTAWSSIATDSKGNIYTTETYEGKRLQKFVYKGMGTVLKEQGVVWPRAR
jgi:hypothetical protein